MRKFGVSLLISLIILTTVNPYVFAAESGLDQNNSTDLQTNETKFVEELDAQFEDDKNDLNNASNNNDELLNVDTNEDAQEQIIEENSSSNEEITTKDNIDSEQIKDEQNNNIPEVNKSETNSNEEITIKSEESLQKNQDTNIELNALKTNINTYDFKTSQTSKLGQIKTTTARIYNDPTSSSYTQAGSSNLNLAFYIKLETTINNKRYYLLSTLPSSQQGTIGWVQADDVTTYDHIHIDTNEKIFYFKGTGVAYNRAWGGLKNQVLNSSDMELLQYKEFKVNMTEKVGNNIWYRGTFVGSNGNIWLHSSHVTTKEESNTSRVGQISKIGVEIYQQIDDVSSIIKANSSHINRVFHIKKQVKIDGKTFYLISTEPSSTDGVIGWINNNDITSYSHTGVDKTSKMMYLKGTGVAYNKIWGGSQNLVFNSNDLEKRKGYGVQIDLTEKVGNNIWYRGILDGEKIWIHSSHVTAQTGNSISKLGKIKSSNTSIYKSLGDSTSITTAGENYTGTVYYIKREAVLGGKTYYLISNQPSSTSGTIGWVEKDNMEAHDHVGIDSNSKIFYLKGTGIAYNRPWGGTKNVVYNGSQMENLKGNVFRVHLTQKVGSNTWYRGDLEGETVWIHSSHLNSQSQNYTTYNLTLEEALAMQMKVNPQTDKYKNDPAYVSAAYVDLYGIISGSTVNLRSSPSLSSTVRFTVSKDTRFEILDDNVKGDSVSNSSRWYQIKYNNTTVYVHSSLATIHGTTNANVNIREARSASSHSYGVVTKGTTLRILDMGKSWHRISYNSWRSAKTEDVRQYLDPNNFIDDPIQRFQFFDISKPSGVSASTINTMLNGKGILSNKGAYFLQAEQDYGVNAVYLVAHALLETGHGTSDLANGVVYNKVKVYNMYGINAFDSNPLGRGAEKAYAEGWTTPELAILGGAEWIAENYIYVGQNTIYNMRWNPASMSSRGVASHQYATDIGWASKQVNTMYQIYNQLDNSVFQFDIPKYR